MLTENKFKPFLDIPDSYKLMLDFKWSVIRKFNQSGFQTLII